MAAEPNSFDQAPLPVAVLICVFLLPFSCLSIYAGIRSLFSKSGEKRTYLTLAVPDEEIGTTKYKVHGGFLILIATVFLVISFEMSATTLGRVYPLTEAAVAHRRDIVRHAIPFLLIVIATATVGIGIVLAANALRDRSWKTAAPGIYFALFGFAMFIFVLTAYGPRP